MSGFKRVLLRAYLLWVYRRPAVRRPLEALRYLLTGQEVTNFTYEIANRDELVDLLAAALRVAPDKVWGWIDEVQGDTRFLDDLRSRLRPRRDRRSEPLFGRRLGWYCLVRHARPSLTVETGSHDGLGTALLLRALERNAAEGAEGALVSVDIDPGSGWLVAEPLRVRLERHVGDARAVLPAVLSGRGVGVFIHDSLHTYEHERFELELALEHRDRTLFLVSDNAHASTALADACRQQGIPYYEFTERPVGHFYPGATMGLGIAGRET